MRKKQNNTMPIIGAFLMLLGIILILFVIFYPSGETVSENDPVVENPDQTISVDPTKEETPEVLPEVSPELPQEESENTPADPEITPEAPEPVPEVTPEEEKMTVDTSLWNLILVNPDNFLP